MKVLSRVLAAVSAVAAVGMVVLAYVCVFTGSNEIYNAAAVTFYLAVLSGLGAFIASFQVKP